MLSNRLVFLHDLHAQTTHLSFSPIVQPAIIKDKLHVVHEVLNASILVLLQLCLDRGEVHRVLDNHRVVINLELLVVDWVGEDVRFLVSLQCSQESLGSFLPLVENWRALRNLRDLKLTYGVQKLTLFISFKVLCDVRIRPFELFKLLISHR